MLTELTEIYIPDIFIHRENQLNFIRKIFSNFKEHGLAGNVILIGSSGAGKTSTLKKIISEQDNHIYISASEANTTNKLLKLLTHSNSHSSSDLLIALKEKFKEDPKILIIDEIGKIIDPENFYNCLNDFYREAQVPIILVTNKWNFIEQMPEDARLTLFLERVEFPSYNAFQISDILNHRIDLIKGKVPFIPSQSSIEYISAKVVKDHLSSIRVALGVLLRCVVDMNDSVDFIERKLDQVKEQEWRTFIHKLTETEKEFINIVLNITENKIEVSMPEINERMDRVGPSRISQLATLFIDYGLLKAKYKNLGKAGGKYRVLEFSRPEHRVKLIKLLNPWEELEIEI